METKDLIIGDFCATVSDGIVDIYKLVPKDLNSDIELPAKKVLLNKNTETFRLAKLTLNGVEDTPVVAGDTFVRS